MLINYRNAQIYQENGAKVLSDVNFSVGEGEMVYLVGKVGSGKSSLLKTIYFELDVDEAEEAMVLDTDIRQLRRSAIPGLRRQMGIIFQDFQLLTDRSIFDNLTFVLRATGWEQKAVAARVEEVLENVGMSDKKDKMPYELSGGEQQRIAIARACLNQPKVILADEPTAHLDEETADGIMKQLQQCLTDKTAIVLATHNMSLLEKFPGRVYRCEDGHVSEETAKSVKENNQ